jgi:hypothetical protein
MVRRALGVGIGGLLAAVVVVIVGTLLGGEGRQDVREWLSRWTDLATRGVAIGTLPLALVTWLLARESRNQIKIERDRAGTTPSVMSCEDALAAPARALIATSERHCTERSLSMSGMDHEQRQLVYSIAGSMENAIRDVAKLLRSVCDEA